MASNPVTKVTEEQYLAIERAAEFRSEFLDGEMFTMSGGSMEHACIQQNLSGELYTALRGTPCRAFGPDLRMKVSSRMYTYPGISVVCGRPLLADEHEDSLLNPVVIVEVLSPSTEKYDRGLKFQHYRTIASLRDYILIDQGQMRIEQYTRQPDDTWSLRDYQRPEQELKIDSIGAAIPLQRIYDRVELPAGG